MFYHFGTEKLVEEMLALEVIRPTNSFTSTNLDFKNTSNQNIVLLKKKSRMKVKCVVKNNKYENF